MWPERLDGRGKAIFHPAHKLPRANCFFSNAVRPARLLVKKDFATTIRLAILVAVPLPSAINFRKADHPLRNVANSRGRQFLLPSGGFTARRDEERGRLW